MKRVFYLILIAAELLFSCNYRYSKYHADWIVTEFTIDNVDNTDIIGMYNFELDIHRKVSIPMGLYLKGQPYMSKGIVPIKIFSKNKTDIIVFESHPFLKGKYVISCLDEVCCEITLRNEQIYLRLVYNGDIPYGKSRSCE